MKRTQRIRFDFYIAEMAQAAERILDYAGDISYHEFSSNSMIRDAVIRNFEILGESVKHIPYSFQRQYKQVPWSRMYGLRNFIVHEYFDVDDEILFAIIHTDLPRNRADLHMIASRLAANPELTQPRPHGSRPKRT